MKQESTFKKFWVKSVNNWLCDADYNGKRLKESSPTPSFRKYYFIKSWEDLNGFAKHGEHDNRELVEKWLSEKDEHAAPSSSGNGVDKQDVSKMSIEELQWRVDNPEAAKWFDAFKDTNKQYAQLLELSIKLKEDKQALKAENEKLIRNKDIAMRLALEYGYKQCEKGNNIQAAFENYNSLTK